MNWSPESRDYTGEENGMYGIENGWFWLPGESDAKATDKGWFWHSNERPKTPERIFQMYLETSEDGISNWERRAANDETTTVGYKRIIPLNGSTADSYRNSYDVKGVRITIEDSKACPLLSSIRVY